MPSCIVKGCTNRSSAKSYRQEEFEKTMKVTFHAFPKCPMKHQLWLNSLRLQNSVLPKRPVVCSLHFRHEDMDRTSLVCVRLRENAIPHVKFSEIIKEENINVYEEISIEETSTSGIIKEENISVYEEISTEEPSTSTSSAVVKLKTGDSVGFTEPISITGGKRRHLVDTGSHEICEKVLKIKSESTNEHMGALLQTSNKSTEAKVSSVDKYTYISPKRLFHSPTKDLLREHISQLKRKHQLELAALNAKITRRNKKIANLQTILQTLKKKNSLEGEQVHSMSGISQFNIELFERMSSKNNKLSVAHTYNSPELRLFSSTLHYYSPRAHCYVRDKGLCLPHPKSLYKCYRSIDGEPGFNDEMATLGVQRNMAAVNHPSPLAWSHLSPRSLPKYAVIVEQRGERSVEESCAVSKAVRCVFIVERSVAN